MSGVDGTRVTGAEAESEAAAGERSDGGVCAKEGVPGNTTRRLTATTALAWVARLLMRALIRACVPGS